MTDEHVFAILVVGILFAANLAAGCMGFYFGRRHEQRNPKFIHFGLGDFSPGESKMFPLFRGSNKLGTPLPYGQRLDDTNPPKGGSGIPK